MSEPSNADRTPDPGRMLDLHALAPVFLENKTVLYRRSFSPDRFDYLGAGVATLTGYEGPELTPELWAKSIEQQESAGECFETSPDEVFQKFKDGAIHTLHRLVLFKCKSGKTRWIREVAALARDETGMPIGAAGFWEDITDLKELERLEQILKAKIADAKPAEYLGRLVGAVAHELNNHLVPVVGYPDLVLSEMSDNDPMREFIHLIRTSGRKAMSCVADLLAMARKEGIVFKPLDLNAVVRTFSESPEYAELMATNIGTTVSFHLEHKIPYIKAAPNRMARVIGNLFISAFESPRNAGTIVVGTRVETAPAHASHPAQVLPAWVVLTFQDSGYILEPDALEHMFEPYYFKTHKGRACSGLALPAIASIVKDVGGQISVTSDAGHGTEFSLYFPALPPGAMASTDLELGLQGKESILVVDDLKEPRDIACRFLTRMGYQMTTAKSGREAVALYESCDARTPFDLILMDMVMEEDFDGLDAIKSIREFNPRQRFIVISGFAQNERVQTALKSGAGQFILKPYSMDQLGQAVRTELDKKH